MVADSWPRGGGNGFRCVARCGKISRGVQRLADEDITLLGGQLQRLDREVEGRELDEPTRIDYQRALDAYEAAQRAVLRIRVADEISRITGTLSTGRYALACVQARVAGQPVPELRVPCFFNPQHGPSVTNVLWNQAGRGTRIVPAYAKDSARVANHEAPEVRQVKFGSRTVWEAGAAYRPDGAGHGGGEFDGGGFDGSGLDGGGGAGDA